MNNIKKLYKFILLLFILYITIPSYSLCAYPELVNRLTDAFIKINNYIKALGGPAAATAIGTGLFIKKFSFGDEERIRIGKKLIKTAIFSYSFLLCTDLVISTIRVILSS